MIARVDLLTTDETCAPCSFPTNPVPALLYPSRKMNRGGISSTVLKGMWILKSHGNGLHNSTEASSRLVDENSDPPSHSRESISIVSKVDG